MPTLEPIHASFRLDGRDELVEVPAVIVTIVVAADSVVVVVFVPLVSVALRPVRLYIMLPVATEKGELPSAQESVVMS